MKTRLATLALPLAVLAGCAENNASVRLEAICAPPDDATVCAFSGKCDAQYIGPNQLDLDTAGQLWLFVQVSNETPDNRDEAEFRTNTNDAFVQEYEIEYPGTGLPTARGPIPGSGNVPAAGTSVISLPVLDEATTAILSTAGVVADGARVDTVAEVKVRGVYADTTSFVTGVFKVPVRACRGCATFGCAPGEVASFCPQNGQTPASVSCEPAQ